MDQVGGRDITSNKYHKGVGRGGGGLSTGHYKRYDNPILLHLEQRYTGAKLRSIGIPQATVADDVALLSWFRYEMQVMVWDVEDNAGRERFIVNPSKSHALKYLSNKRKENDEDIFLCTTKRLRTVRVLRTLV